MPRPKRIASYPAFCWKLYEAAEAGIPELVFDRPAYEAHKLRHKIYGFTYALEAEAHAAHKAGNMTLAAQRLNEANTMRGYLLSVTIDGVSVGSIKPGDERPAKFHFINRDLTEEMRDLEAQLEAQVGNLPEHKSINLDNLDDVAPTAPAIPDFLSGPLQVREDADTEIEEDTKPLDMFLTENQNGS